MAIDIRVVYVVVVVVTSADIVVAMVFIIVGTRNLTLKYGQNQVSNS